MAAVSQLMRRLAFRLAIPSLALVCLSNCKRAPEPSANELPAWLTAADASPRAAEEETGVILRLALQPGDRFPLRKIVEQELLQDSLTSAPQISRSRLELMFGITVAEQREDRLRLSVRYDRVKYQRDVADDHIAFDSAHPDPNPPPEVRVYRDMVHDGFEFWLGPDNQIVEVSGLKEFIDRCLRDVPPEKHQEVMLGVEAGSGETGIANFIDNTIGLLPFGGRTRPGDVWERDQHISRPVPMHVSQRYTLKELNDQLAVIDIRGSITPSTTVSAIDNGQGVRVSISGGDITGSCSVYRETGLPRESRVDRRIDMKVSMANMIEFRQRKRITTWIESFPAAAAPAIQLGTAGETAPPTVIR